MSELERDALRVSQVLDDRIGGGLEDRFAGQRRVHAGLSARDAAPCERARVDITARVMTRLGAPAVRSSSVRAWPVAAAAGLTLLAGIGWVVVRSARPVAAPAPAGTELASTGPAPSTPAMATILNPFKDSDIQVRASLDATFVQQARLIQQDTQQGMEMVLSRLPLGNAAAAK